MPALKPSTPHNGDNLDLLRAACAWLILFSHSFVLYDNSPDPLVSLFHFDSTGMMALHTFFVIGGYLVTASYLHRTIGDFVRNRLLRVMPALAVVVLLAMLALGPIMTTLPLNDYFTNGKTWSYALNIVLWPHYTLPGVFAANPYPYAINGSLWTLRIESICYALLLFTGIASRRPATLIAWLAILAGLSYALFAYNYADRELAGSGRWFFAFFCGSAYYLLRDRLPPRLPIFVAAIALAFFCWYGAVVSQLIYFLCLSYIIIFLALKAPARSRWLKGKDLSYGIYLYAFPVQQCYMQVAGQKFGFAAFIIISSVITIICAWLSWHYVERFWLAKKRNA